MDCRVAGIAALDAAGSGGPREHLEIETVESEGDPHRFQLPLKPVLIVAPTGLILSAVLARFARQSVDYPAILFLNGFAARSTLLDYVMVALMDLNLLKGVALVALIWFTWFDAPEPESRAKIAAGVIAASLAGGLSRVLQLVLPTHSRPLVDSELSLVVPHGLNPLTLNHWNAFPSDHGTLLSGLAMVIVFIRPRVGIVAFAASLVIELSRVYGGLHYPTDIAGGVSLGMAMVGLSQLPVIWRSCLVLARRATERPGFFYAAAFVATYSTATLFDDVRTIGRGLVELLWKT